MPSRQIHHRARGRTAPPPAQAGRARAAWEQGRELARQSRWSEAAVAFEAAVALAPQDPVFLLNAARAAQQCGDHDRALARVETVLARDPGNTVARQIGARSADARHRPADVLRYLGPLADENDAELHRQRGHALMATQQPHAAIESFFKALSLDLRHAHTHYELGLAFNLLKMKVEAAECFRTALALGAGPGEVGLRGLLATFERDACRWGPAAEELEAFREAARRLRDGDLVWTTPFVHATLVDDPAEQLAMARHCSHNLASKVTPLSAPPATRRPGRLRLGYLSGDFHQHATAILMAEMLEAHDRDRVEVTLYSHGPDDGTAMRARMVAACEHFVEVRHLSDDEAAQRIRDDAIDILVDLKGYTLDHRLQILARRPAPVQVSFLGYPGTTGAPFIDYVVGDPIVTPLTHAPHWSEKIAQMPVCYQPNDRQRALPPAPSRASLGLPEQALVLCGFNQPYKISPEVFDVWCALLHELPDAVLWLLQWNDVSVGHLQAEAAARGIEPQRLVFAPKVAPADHIARLQQADLFIDTWPCNAHTTASDALWAGVPVVTRTGEVFASRVAASLVHAVGLGELACASTPEYEARILALAADPAARAALRARLVAARDDSPLFDSARFTRDFEALMARVHARHEDGLPPDHLAA